VSALELEDVFVSLGRAEIVRGVDVTVEHGEWVALIGPNGAGKTTILRAVAGLVPFAGSITVDGVGIDGLSRRELSRRLALVPQIPHIPEELTVAEYVLLGRTPYIPYFGLDGARDRRAAAEALGRLALGSFADRRLGSLSGGELQRVVLARSLAQEAPLLLLDEPTTALDLGRQQQVLELVDELRRDHGLTVFSTMHDLSLAGQYADRLLLLDAGRIEVEGTPPEVLSESSLRAYYGASVRIVRENGHVFVLPWRREPV
jgi:iron complex transport system ATP-binding protein